MRGSGVPLGLLSFCWSLSVAAAPVGARDASLGPGDGAGQRSLALPGADEASLDPTAGAGRPEVGTRGARADELDELGAAERVLFPRPLVGARSGWSWGQGSALNAGSAGSLDASSPFASGDPTAGEGRAPDAVLKDLNWFNSLVMPDLPVVFTNHVIRYLRFYRDDPRGRAIARGLLAKSRQYSTAIQAALVNARLPADLVWLSLIESGHDPEAKSPAGAAGLWQFIPDSARSYGLVVDRYLDERLDPSRSTDAAVRYLADLYRHFGTWELAMAAYNMGHGGVTRAVRKFGTNDFWALCRFEAGVPWETTLYVPKILALALVMNNRRAFGLDAGDVGPVEDWDTVLVSSGTTLGRVASAAHVPAKDVYRLNPQLLLRRVPAGVRPGYPVRLPAGTGERVSRALQGQAKLARHRVRLGDSLDTIAEEAGVSAATLRKVNALSDDASVERGTVLIVPEGPDTEPSRKAPELVVALSQKPASGNLMRIFYRVLGGETLPLVAQALGVSAGDLASWNALDAEARLVSGMTLQAFVKKSQDLSRVRYIAEADSRVLVPGTSEFYDYFEGLNGNKRVIVRAKKGDTLASLGARYGMTLGSIERVNRRSRHDELSEGEAVVVYSKAAVSADPLPAQAPRPDARTGGGARTLPTAQR